MKSLYYSCIITILLLLTVQPAYPQCGNDDKNSVTHCYCCPEDGPYPLPPCGNPQATFSVYPGNSRRTIQDLVVWGGVGDHQLTWIRYYNSREFRGWTHSYEFRMADAGSNSSGQNQISVFYPEGGANTFTQSTSNPSVWLPASGVDKRLFQSGNVFVLQMADGYRYRFENLSNPSGGNYYQLQDFRDPYQNIYRLTYNSSSRLIKVTEPGGRYLAMTDTLVDGIEQLSSVTSSNGRSVVYHYDVYDDGVSHWIRLRNVNYGDGTTAFYTYTQPTARGFIYLEHAIDPRVQKKGLNIKYTYNDAIANGYIKEEVNGATGQVLATLIPEMGKRTVCYPNGKSDVYIAPVGLLGSITEYTDGLGRTTKYSYDDGGIGFVRTLTDPLGRVTTFTRTVYGNPLDVIYADGSKESWTRDELDQVMTYTDELGRVTTYTRDNRHQVTRIRYPDGTTERFTYNHYSQVLTHTRRNGAIEVNTYSSKGLKTTSYDALGYPTQYTYDSADRLASITDTRSNTKKFGYNERGLLDTLTNADNSFQTYTYDNFGNRTSVTNELGNTWETAYDEFRRPVIQTDPLNRAIVYKYDLAGGICGCAHTIAKPTSIILPSGRTTTITYDVEWQKTAETAGAGTADAATTFYEYDLAGNLTELIDPRRKQWRYEYDERNQLVNITDPLGHKTGKSYDAVGNILKVTRQDGSTTKYTYDSMNRKTLTADAKGASTKMKYDKEGNIVKITDANGRNYDFKYDPLNRRKTIEYPGNSLEIYDYDQVGNLKTYINRSSDVRTYMYDNRNRDTASTWSDNTPAITRSYDAAGRLLTLSSDVSTLSYTYNATNELTSETQAIDGANGGDKTVSYSYNADGLLETLGYPENSTRVNYGYTGRNQLENITAAGMANMAATYKYDLNGNRVAKSYDNETSTVYAYDNDNRLLKADNQKGGISFALFQYGYDAVHRRTYVKHDNNKGDLYSYDSTDQVTGVQYDVTNPEGSAGSPLRMVNYVWDATGNRKSVADNGTTTNYITNNRNQYVVIDFDTLTYNSNGALKTFDNWKYTYDAQDRLIRVEKGDTLVRFAYDAHNRRVRQTINGAISYLYYDGWNLIEERNRAGNIHAQYVHGRRIDEILTKSASRIGTVYYYNDALGNVTHLANSAGNVAEKYSYDVFGAVSIRDGNGNPIPTSAFDNRFLFTGREWIHEIKLYDYRNRMYSPEVGRFLQADPIRFAAGDVNLYRYVGNNTTNWTDPTGFHNGYHPGIQIPTITIDDDPPPPNPNLDLLWSWVTSGDNPEPEPEDYYCPPKKTDPDPSPDPPKPWWRPPYPITDEWSLDITLVTGGVGIGGIYRF